MVNKRLKKLTALLLSIVMVFPMVTEAFPAAFADEEGGGSTPSTGTTQTENRNFGASSATRRPGLYVDFLGDNRNYQPLSTNDDTNERDEILLGADSILDGLVAPGLKDQGAKTNAYDATTNPNGTRGQWGGYGRDESYIGTTTSIYDGETIFWVGVGIDRMNALELFENQNNGIYSQELGFYYDSRYIEPYTGEVPNDDAGYLQVIQAANLQNYKNYQWEGYSIVDARTDLETHTDPVTQEVIKNPDMEEILGQKAAPGMGTGAVNNPWRLTYVSLEKRADNTNANRFSEIKYDVGEDTTDLETKYLLIIPFRLKKFDTDWPDSERLCLRLARSAGLLSIGSDDGDTPYAAWERVTTRNPGHELKLMTNFQGDLDIFGGVRRLESPLEATLLITRAGGSGNTATLTIENDPSPTPVFADDNGEVISGLYGGTGMRLDVHVETGYSVTVDVYYTTDDKLPKIRHTYTWTNDNDGIVTFIMPEHNATVEVTFQVTSAKEFRLYLDEQEQDADRNPVTAPTGIQGNSTVLTATYTEVDNTTVPPTTNTTVTIVDKDSPDDNSEHLPGEMVHFQSQVTADIKVHGDYEAVVSIYNIATGQNIAPARNVTGGPHVFPDDGTVGADYVMVLPTGGQITFLNGMPESDVIVHVTYRPATKYNVLLSVYHDPEEIQRDNNVAQLWTTVYDLTNQPRDAYSGVVYEKVETDSSTDPATVTRDHSAVKSPFRLIDLVDASSASGSRSLGGDGRTPTPWLSTTAADNIMAMVYAAYTAPTTVDAASFQTALAGKVAPLDLRSVQLLSGATAEDEIGLRKNAKGEFYTDSDLAAASGSVKPFYEALYQLLQQVAAAETATPGTYLKNMPDPDDITGTAVLYSYFDLTPAQLQAYFLEYEAYGQYVIDKAQYDADKAQYDIDKAAYDKYQADLKAAEDAGLKYEGPVVRKPTEPTEPTVVDPPALLDDTSAAAKVTPATGKWYKPSATSMPPTRPSDAELLSGQGNTLQVRGGRKMAVVLEAESTYTVASGIRIIDKSGAGRADIVLDVNDPNCPIVRSPDYQNVYLFDMPAYDCEVRVIYTERKAQELTLKISGDYWDGTTTVVPGNIATVTGYGPNAGSITAAPITPMTKDSTTGGTRSVLEDSQVKVVVRKDVNYTVSATVEYIDTSGTTPVTRRVSTTPSSTTNMGDNTTFYFDMPKGAATITITYVDDRPEMNAHLVFSYLENANTGNGGVWHDNGLTQIPAREGDALTADITVLPGSYIYAVEAYTEHGSFPVTLSGNGWNNGLGGTVKLDTVMPDEEYWVHVVFMPGPPKPEPGQILRLRVIDRDNTVTPLANNWAKATLPDVPDPADLSQPLTLGEVGLVASPSLVETGGTSASQFAYVTAGDKVVLDFGAASGFFTESIEIKPAGLGVALDYFVDDNGTPGDLSDDRVKAQFTMPAASAEVEVTFRRRTSEVTPERLYLHLDKTESGGTNAGNTIPSFTSPTIRNVLSDPDYRVSALPAIVPTGGNNIGAAQPGERVEVNIDIAPGWYIHSVTVSGEQGRLAYNLYQTYDRSTNTGTNYDPVAHYNATGATKAVAAFVMPNSDAYVTVNYRKGPDDPGEKPDPDPNELEIELMVEDPENIGTGSPSVYADNWASAVIGGDLNRTIAAVGKAKDALRRTASARAGEEVVIDYSAAAGYALEIILVTPSGLRVPVNYFIDDMGDADPTNDTVRARFTMPDSSVTAIVRFKREPAIQYTANLVLHFPDGTAYNLYDTIGEGSFVTDLNGRHYDLANKLYSMIATPGTRLDFDLFAHDKYYISNVTVGPEVLGVPVQYTGSFGHQSGHVIMPAADIQINVFFDVGWPDDTQDDPTTVNYDLTLEVYDASGRGSTANFESIGKNTLTTPNSDLVHSGDSLTVTPRQSYDEDRVVVKLNPASGCYAKSITVTDSRGKNVPWQYVPGGIAFEMTPAHVTVTVKYDKLPDPGDPDFPDFYDSHRVTLHMGITDGTNVTWGGDFSAVGTAVLTGTGSQRADDDGESFLVTVPPQGQTLTLVVTPNTGYYVAAAYAIKPNGEHILLPMTQVPSGGTATFAMPDSDADVYVIFADSTNSNTPGPDPDRGDLTGTLIVAGPTGAGSAVMHGTIVDPTGTAADVNVTTGTVAASGAGSLYAPYGTELLVDLTVTSGYSIAAIRVTDGNGDRVPYEWVEGQEGSQFTLTMAPTGGVRVYVELEKTTSRGDPNPDPEDLLRAQVVVNNGGEPENKAELRYGPNKASPILSGALLTPVYAGDEIWVDIQVAPGYQIEYVKVVPAKYGINPTLYDLPVYDQSTSFLMPGEDVVVYVKFVQDNRTRRTVTLYGRGDEDTPASGDPIQNNAIISSPVSGPQNPVHPVTLPTTAQVQAAPSTATLPAEWVTVDYTWADGYYTSIRVEDTVGNLVPFTQTENKTGRKGQITFPMVDANVNVTVTWSATPVTFPAVIHVIDLDDPDNTTGPSWGELTWTDPAGTDHQTGHVLANGEATLQVPEGEIVQVDAEALVKDGVTYYIQAAYVLFREYGQMISFQSSGTPGAPAAGVLDQFVMHPGQNDVYVYVTSHPPKDPYSAVLMLDSPSDDTGPNASSATMTNTSNTDDPSDPGRVKTTTVIANTPVNGHGYVTAGEKDTITVTVKPAPGYVIESILMTPLGTSTDQGGTVKINVNPANRNLFSFEMPAHNVAVRVKLRKSNDREYTATLHYQMVELDENNKIVSIRDVNRTQDWAQLSYIWSGLTTTWSGNGESQNVPEGATVNLGASITGSDYVLAAYVLREDGDMVPLDNMLEGLNEQHSSPNNTLLDDSANFTMPAANVHAYVWFTNKEPLTEWHTAVLTVFDTDPTNASNNNSGLNSATIESEDNNTTPVEVISEGVPAHKFIWVENGELVTVKTKKIENGYSYVDTTITHSDATATQTLNPVNTTSQPYTHNYTVGNYNSAVVVRYEKSEVTRNPLNVVLIDRDNPGNGRVTNAASVQAGSVPRLDVTSVTSAGARQRISSVLSGTIITFNIDPNDDPQYTAYVRLKDSAGNVITTYNWLVGTTNGTFAMPNGETTLEITYFRGREVKLSVVDTRGTSAPTSSAQMKENAFNDTVTADSTGVVGTFAALPDGTELAASLTTLADNTHLIGVLVIDSSGTRWISPTAAGGVDEYRHILAGRDVEIRMIVGPDSNPNQFVASVSAVNLPNGTAAPTIAVTTPGPNATSGANWTVANQDDILTVTVVVPEDYAIDLTTDTGIGLSPISMTADGTATFTMPADNAHVTVTYRKTAFKATIVVTPTAGGSADLSNGTTTVTANTAADTIYHLTAGTNLTYTATPNTDYTVTRVLMTTASGVTQLLTGGSVAMPADDVTITVFFDKDDDIDRHHIAFVTVVDPANESLNAAQEIQNTTDTSLGGGFLWEYGDKDHEMKVIFTVAPGYTAKVTAKQVGSNTPVSVTQQGGNNLSGTALMNATATLTMPDADVEVTITYTKDPPIGHQLKLRLVGHGQVTENQATLYAGGYGSTSQLTLVGSSASDLNDYWSGALSNILAGTQLDLDASRHTDYIIERATIGLLDPSDTNGRTVLAGTETILALNEYGTTATNLHYMPDEDAVVTVYYRLPYEATLFVVDSAGNDYDNGTQADTADTTQNRTPKVTMSVNRTDLTPNTTTKTHDPIGNLDGTETVTTQVDLTTMPTGDEIASVIATTSSGTVHLAETATDSGIYEYLMSTATRRADDVDITVILRKDSEPKMYTATVYKVDRDNLADNWATIENPTTMGLPNGTIWTGAMKDDVPVVKVTTAPGYYAIVTAVQTGTTTNVPVLQWVTQGTASNPIEATFTMPAHDVDVTVTYTKDPPKANMTLTLKDHDGKAENKGDLYKDATAVPDLTVSPLPITPFLSANGGEAPIVPISPPPATGPTTEPKNPFSKTTTTPVDAGDYLALAADHGTGHYIKSITFKAAGFTFDMLNNTSFVPRVPVSGGEIIIEFAPGKQSGRPYDPEHSQRYYGTTVRLDPTDNTKLGNYVTGGTGDENPDLSVAPKLGQQGWILAEEPDPEKLTVVVTVPTLFDEDTTLSDKDALADAGVNPQATPPVDSDDPPLPVPPTYKFYWWDKDKSEFVLLVEGTDYTVTDRKSLDYLAVTNENPKGDYPRDADGTASVHHYGYRLTLQATDSATASDQAKALAKYIEDGGEIYVTATRPGTVPFTPPIDNPTAADPKIPWVESEKTQIIIKPDNVLKPYDPDRVNPDGTADPTYEDHWIRAENRGDYLLVTVPMLNNKAGDNPTEVDGKIHRLQLHLQVDGTDRNSTIINVTEYLNIQNVRNYNNFWNVNLEYDPKWSADPVYPHYLFDPYYENEIYYKAPGTDGTPNTSDDVPYHGARFAVSIKDQDPDSTDPVVLALRKIFDNEGTMNGTASNYRMYITSDEVDTTLSDPLTDPLPTFRKDDYTDFEVPRYYSLAGELQSWAPTHIAELTLYRADAGTASGYEEDPWLMLRSGLSKTMSSTGGYPPAIYNGHWSLEFAFKSSELVAEDGTALTYQMVVEKTAHLTYTHTAIELDTTAFAGTWYDAGTMKFSFASPISLFCGDIAPTLPGPNQIINDQDRNLLAGFNYGTYAWNDGENDAATDWGESTYNPYSYAYMADLNGDGIISEQDMAILMSEFNWKRRTRDYGDPSGLDFGASGIMLLLEDFLDEETAGDEAAEGEQPSEDAALEEGADPAVPTETPEDPKDPESSDGTEDPDDTTSEEPGAPEDSEGAEGTDTPEDPEEPVEPESPTEPVIPENPIEPEDPTEPASPGEPKDPDGGDTPEVPEESTDPVPPQPETDPDQTPADPVTPSEPEDPETPEKPEDSDLTVSPGESAPETSGTENAEPKQPDAESGGTQTPAQDEQSGGGGTADPTSTADPDQSAEKIA